MSTSNSIRPKTRRAGRAFGLVASLLAILLFAAPSSSALDYYQPGSVSKGPWTARWAIAGVTYYSLTISDRWSWSAGNSTTSKISGVAGTTTAAANLINQTQNALGPVDSARNPISTSTKFGSATTVYHFMQARACLVSGANFVCNPWTWHRVHATLHSGGTWSPSADY